MKNYVFGYGSLLEKQSRTLTVPNATEAFPAKVFGLLRGWWARTKVDGLSTTYLGCLYSDSAYLKMADTLGYVNGVMFEVTGEEIAMLDDREKNYTRIQVDPSNIHVYGEPLKSLPVWVYINDLKSEDEFLQSVPEKSFPIVQSYVDICINGCLEIEANFPKAKEEHFLEDFILSTIYWSKFWANDRIYPRRPHIYCKNAFLIDTLLKKTLKDPVIFESIYIE